MPPRFPTAMRLVFAAVLTVPLAARAGEQPVDFVRDVRPIFQARCVSCHGQEKQRGGLRLDVGAAALQGSDTGPVILPGKPGASPLIQRVTSRDAGEVMPPKGPRLSDAEVARLRAWIDRGAVWPAHADSASQNDPRNWWSLRPLRRPGLPFLRAEDAAWVRNPLDVFVLARLRESGLGPSAEADRRTLIRRLYFDLLGLPPAPEAVDAFVADLDPFAYERLVDRLLSSPHYGERWARHWLDVVHYGETHGYDKDKPRLFAWPYRDYVIRAFNLDTPYVRFVQEQLAGDVLFPGTPDGIEALGFIAAGPWDFIGHAELPETKIDGKVARHLDRDDMVANTINTFTSLTVHCAQCHNHKFDPIPQEDYYRLQAVFAALDRADRTYDRDPAVGRQRLALERRRRELESTAKKLDARLRKLGGAELAELDRQLAAARKPGPATQRAEFGYHSAIEREPNRVKWVQVDLGRSVAIDHLVVTGCYDDFNRIGAGFGFPLRYKIEVAADAEFRKGLVVAADQTADDVANPGTAPQRVSVGGQVGRFVRVTATRLAPRQNDYVFALAELSVVAVGGETVSRGAAVSASDSIRSAPPVGQT